MQAILTGEGDFSDFTGGGPGSPFTCSNKVVIQGFDREEFGRFLQEYLQYMGLRTEGGECEEFLFNFTGGQRLPSPDSYLGDFGRPN